MKPHDPHQVALQDEWLRRVARALIRDADLASDLVQDAWVASLSRKRGATADRPWLRGVVRHSASSFFRRRSRREEREREAAQPPTSPPQDEVSAQLELRERMAHELGSLEEPFRTAIYLRFVEGLSVRETARRLDVAGSTVVARVQKGLSRLRHRLDEAHGGDRRQWSALLLPWALRVTPLLPLPLPLPITLVTMLAATFTLAATLFLVGIPALASTDPTPIPIEPAAAPGVTEATTKPLLAEVSTTIRRNLADAAAIEPSAPTAPLSQANGDAHLRARFFRPNGSPAVQIPWKLKGWPANEHLTLEYGEPADWADPTGFTDIEGWIRLDFASHPAYVYSLEVDHPDYVAEHWQWAGIRPGETKAVPDTVLRLPGALRGVVVDEEGVPLAQRSWRVHAGESLGTLQLGQKRAGAQVVTATEGSNAAHFQFDRLPEGNVSLTLYDQLLGTVQGPTVTVVAGETTEIAFALPQFADAERSIVVRIRSKYVPWRDAPTPDQVSLIGPFGDRKPARALHARRGAYTFENVGPGPHRMEVEDPRILPWSQEGVMAGSYVQADLTGNAGLALTVMDTQGNTPAAYAVNIRKDRLHGEEMTYSSPSRLPVEVDSNGLVEGLLPGNYVVTVRHGDLQESVTVSDLGANELRGISVVLAESPIARGFVRFPNGDPAPGVTIRAVTPAAVNDSPASLIIGGMSMSTNVEITRRQVSRTATDEVGFFAIALGDAPHHILVVGKHPAHQVESEPIAPAQLSSSAPLEFEVRRSAFLSGTVRLPEGLKVIDWLVLFVQDEPAVPMPTPSTLMAYVDADGSFDFGAVDESEGTLVLMPSLDIGIQHGVIPASGRTLGRATLRTGESWNGTFDFPGTPPISAHFTLPSDALPAPGASTSIWLRRRPNGPPGFATGTGLTLGPIALEPGLHEAWVVGGDWVAQPRDLTVPENGPAEVHVELSLSTQRVRAMVGATPLANTTIEHSTLPQGAPSVRYTTDAQGYMDVRLGPGTYQLHERCADVRNLRVARLCWPLEPGFDIIVFESR